MRTLLIAVFVAALVAAPVALAGYGSGYAEHRAEVCTLKTITTASVPGQASVRIRVFANGRELSGVASGSHEFQWMGRGVAVLGRSRIKAGPMRFRIANLRESCSRLRITYRWQTT